MQIGGLQKLTLIDFPNKLACTVFLCGCNYRCPWCYSAPLVLPALQRKLPDISEKDFFSFLKERKKQLEGVVLCGGEPTVHNDLPRFCRKIKKVGYKVKLDTNGSNPSMLKYLIDKKLVDYVALDIKAPKEKYPEATGFKDCSFSYLVDKIDRSIGLLKEDRVGYELRTTLHPLLEKEDIIKIAQWLKPARRYILQNFKPETTIDPKLKYQKAYPESELQEIQKAIAPFFELCQVR